MESLYSLVVKFAHKREYLEKMQTGIIYCNPIKYFKDLEDGQVRGDHFESVIEIKTLGKGTLMVKPKNEPDTEWLKLEYLRGNEKLYYTNPLGNLFCLSSIIINPGYDPTIFEFDQRFRLFGNYFLLIYNEPVFLERLANSLKNLKIKGCGKRIEYLDFKNYSGKKTIFQKDVHYSWQQEYRFFLDRDDDKPFEFNIGDISDISRIYDLNKQKSFLIKRP